MQLQLPPSKTAQAWPGVLQLAPLARAVAPNAPDGRNQVPRSMPSEPHRRFVLQPVHGRRVFSVVTKTVVGGTAWEEPARRTLQSWRRLDGDVLKVHWRRT
mmetsp:Transcript_52978/g.147542  ORF Transcript_52978/g.147542 Transcript_52978/m.147542 type:complete len:101 (-) Transcript_52978:204-506(-)